LDDRRRRARVQGPTEKEIAMPSSLDDWIEGYRLAWESRDADAAAQLFTADATYRSNIFEEPHVGREGVADYWRSVTAGQSEVRVRMGRPFAAGPRVAVEFWTNMYLDGDETTLPGCLLLDFDDEGLCRRLREYWSFTAGAHEPPPEWGE
jgi:nuclear transport factor 2 (NTF2) superfamily protein